MLASLLMMGGAVFAQKLSPSTELLLLGRTAGVGLKSVTGSASDQTFDAYVKISDQSVLSEIERLGGKVRTNMGGNLVTMSLPVATLREVAALDAVNYIQAAGKVYLRTDKARADVGVDQCHTATAGMEAYTGSGIVVGLVDTGMDYTHIAYCDRTGTTLRLSKVWDQNQTGTPPEGFDYGTEYATPARVKAKRYDTKSQYHAGHVLGIAAGADMTSDYYGMAPDADLVYVSMGDNTAAIADGVKYIFDYAKSVGKPCVVNLSLGTHLGPHDGTSSTDQMFDQLAGPGRIIVGACGNEGENTLHAGKTIAEEGDSLRFMIAPNSYGESYVDIWGTKNTQMTVKVVIVDTRNGRVKAESAEVSTAQSGSRTVRVTYGQYTASVGLAYGVADNNMEPNVLADVSGYVSGNYRVGIIATSETGSTIHAWQALDGDAFEETTVDGWTSGDTDYTAGEVGGTGKSVISVGAYNTRLSWTDLSGSSYNYNGWAGQLNGLSAFSSHGPTADGRRKPDVTAPGCGIISAMSKWYSGFNNATCVAKSRVGSLDYYYQVLQGTSQATPVVTGTVALWLQANPDLTPDDIRDVIDHTARLDDYTGDTAEGNNLWGAGKIDAYAGLQYVLKNYPTAISDAHVSDRLFRVVSDRASHTAQVYFDGDAGEVALTVYNALGQQVAGRTLTASGASIDLSAFGTGVYIFRLQRGNTVKTIKTAL